VGIKFGLRAEIQYQEENPVTRDVIMMMLMMNMMIIIILMWVLKT